MNTEEMTCCFNYMVFYSHPQTNKLNLQFGGCWFGNKVIGNKI